MKPDHQPLGLAAAGGELTEEGATLHSPRGGHHQAGTSVKPPVYKARPPTHQTTSSIDRPAELVSHQPASQPASLSSPLGRKADITLPRLHRVSHELLCCVIGVVVAACDSGRSWESLKRDVGFCIPRLV
ncbi:hypothetical protein Pcinc_039849 [Petrolisthes cinctipes]|uniref:Uncharacterized protein n=1 Tax=Petrolisthes cinctipes TaxID=88211 RepID=A0AAE1BMM0_PETCI|nr:hypothetical protein Pcinc_039849 [Petrolisthes cinctipes]